jgi:3-hydroxyacyl-CoA dehydrogenase
MAAGVATVADIDTAISDGPGVHWALMGPPWVSGAMTVSVAHDRSANASSGRCGLAGQRQARPNPARRNAQGSIGRPSQAGS